MPQTRKLVRDAIRAEMAHETTGFNAIFEALERYDAEDHPNGYRNIPDALDIDWSGSETFCEIALDESTYGLSQLAGPYGVSLSTSLSQTTDGTKFRKFAGDIIANLDFWVRHSAVQADDDDGSMETDDTESIGDAIEDAVIEVMSRAIDWRGTYGVSYSGNIAVPRGGIIQLGDGYRQRVPIQFLFRLDN
jgi:hypothetical protein